MQAPCHHRSIRTLLLLLVLAFTTLAHAQKKEEKLVRKAFDAYKTAILNDKGEDAADLVDSRTIQYYQQALDQVRTADSATVRSLSLMDRLMVFSIRHRTPKEDILRFDGRALYVYAVQSGMVGKNSVAGNSIGEVVVEGTFAKGRFLVGGEETPFQFHFYKEEERWKLDLTSLFPISTMAFQTMVEDSGQEENEFLFTLLEKITGRKPGPEVWQPVLEG